MTRKLLMLLAGTALIGNGGMSGLPAPAGNASITGKVVYTGTPPKMKPIDMAKEPSCAKQHESPVMTENVATVRAAVVAGSSQ